MTIDGKNQKNATFGIYADQQIALVTCYWCGNILAKLTIFATGAAATVSKGDKGDNSDKGDAEGVDIDATWLDIIVCVFGLRLPHNVYIHATSPREWSLLVLHTSLYMTCLLFCFVIFLIKSL